MNNSILEKAWVKYCGALKRNNLLLRENNLLWKKSNDISLSATYITDKELNFRIKAEDELKLLEGSLLYEDYQKAKIERTIFLLLAQKSWTEAITNIYGNIAITYKWNNIYKYDDCYLENGESYTVVW